MEKDTQVIFDRNTIEFVTVAAEFCKYMEHSEGIKRSVFVDTTLKILPLLYLKAAMLPECQAMGDEAPENYVTEETYEVLRMTLAGILAEKDAYLDVFVEDMKYSDQPITRNISEDLADIYQDIKDFIFVFQLGLHETMHDALAICQENFRLYWGQKLVNTLRALHEVRYAQTDDEEEDEADGHDDCDRHEGYGYHCDCDCHDDHDCDGEGHCHCGHHDDEGRCQCGHHHEHHHEKGGTDK